MRSQKILERISSQYQRVLKENLVGIYLHGSMAFGCFNWNKSDIDFIVVVQKSLTTQIKGALMDCTMSINEQAPPKGLEMSIVLKELCENFVYPTPYELHFSNLHQQEYLKDPDSFCKRMQGQDKDLAAHFTVIRYTGIVLCGEPIPSVFSEIPKRHYLDSIQNDFLDMRNHILVDPAYVILNLCRTAAYMQEGLILSKEQGGLWGIANLDDDFHMLIKKALESYQKNIEINITQTEAELFCQRLLVLVETDN